MSDTFQPSLEYDGTSGHQDAESSRDATHHADVSGITNKAQRYALILASQRGAVGVTVAELREIHGSLHHGRISAALTNLHKAGRLAALTERRNHCGIYVLPEYVEGREVRPFHPNRRGPRQLSDARIVDLYWQSSGDNWAIPDEVMIAFARSVIAEADR